MNQEQKTVYPEQENPPRATYECNMRGTEVHGFLDYNYAPGQVTITIVTTSPDGAVSSSIALCKNRVMAKLMWLKAVMEVA